MTPIGLEANRRNLDVAIEIVRRTALELQAAEELAVPKGARKNG